MVSQTMPILSVKFKIPEPRKNYISRKELMTKLKAMNKKKVTIVKAGAGSGKTTLLTSFIKENDCSNVRWITLDENMNQVFIFWKYVLEGTKDFLGDLDGDFIKWFDSNVQKDTLWQLLSMYMNKLCQDTEIILVLDDFQTISNQFLLSTIDFLIANMPDNLHLVLIARSIPDIYLGTISMEDNLLLIDEQEIRMSDEESRDFLVHTLGIDAGEDRIHAMINNSNGWVGGLQLMAVAAKEQSKTTIPDFNTTSRLIGDYITHEIYLYLTEEEREFLQKTSILGYFNQKICEQFVPQFNFNEILGSILKKNLFVVSIDEEAMVYRYHSIMKEYLLSLFEKDLKQLEHLHTLAADIYYQLGDFDECLSQLFAINAYERIMKLILKMPQTALTFSYMMKVPMEEIGKNTDFAYQYFFCHYAGMDVDACERIYHFITNNLKEDQTLAAFKHADLFFNVNWKFQNIAIIPFDQIDDMPLNPVTKAYLLIKEAYFLFLADQCQDAYRYLDKAHEIYENTGNAYIEAFILFEKTQILESNGELKQSVQLYKRAEKFLVNIPTMKASYYIGIAGVYIRQLAIEKAKEALIQAKEAMIYHVDNVYNAYLYTLAELSYVIGEHQKTEEIILDLAKEEVYQSIYFTARLLRYPIYRGSHNEMAVKFTKDYEQAEELLKNMDSDLLYIGIIYENGEIDKANILVDSLIAKARKSQNKLKIVEGALLKTRMMLEHKCPERELLNLFVEAVSYAFENTIAVPFWFEKKTVSMMIDQYQTALTKKISMEELEFVQSILKADTDKGLVLTLERSYDLTERELEVLSEMKKGYTNKQIAEKLCISIATVKSHIINIYGKLQVNNRVAAINKMKN